MKPLARAFMPAPAIPFYIILMKYFISGSGRPTVALLSALSALLLGASHRVSAAPIYEKGDLIVSFRATGADGNADVSYSFTLGSAINYRDASAGTTFSFDLGADLATAFGTNWAIRSDIYWGIVGVYSSLLTGSPVNGDPVRTIYASQDQTVLGTQSAAPVITASGTRGTVANNIQTFAEAFDTFPQASNPRGSIVGASTNNNDYQEYGLDGASDFGSTFGFNGIEGNSPLGVSHTALDLYRILNTTTGADPTGLVGTGSYEGTFTIDNSGTLSFAVMPEPTTGGLLMLATGVLSGLGRFRRRNRMVAC